MAAGCANGGSEEERAPNVVEGVVVDVEAASLGEVQSFTVKDGDETYEVLVDSERDYGFPVSHLSEHIASADPVRVELEQRNGRLYAVTIEDV